MTGGSAAINDIKGGKYQLVAEVWDRILSDPGQPYNFERFVKGDVVTLTDSEAKRLVSSGAFVKPGEFERLAVEQLKAQLALAEAQVEAAQARLDDADGADSDGDGEKGTGKGGEGKSVTSVPAILESVGDDKAKAQAALDAENATDKPRTTLVTSLEAILKAD